MLLNLDETSIPLVQPAGVRGNLLAEGTRWDKSKRLTPALYLPREKQRAHFTYVAIVCDDPTLQPLLPQVLIFSEKQLGKARARELQKAMPPNVFVITQKTAWTNHRVHGRIVRLLGQVLAHFPERQPILLQDAAGAHCQPEAVTSCYCAGIWPVFIPALTTWLLQPLDTHGFASFKRALHREYGCAFPGLLRPPIPEDVCPLIARCIRRQFQGRRWKDAFHATGWTAGQAGISSYVQREVGVNGAALEVGCALPTLEQLKQCFASNLATLTVENMLSPWVSHAPAAAAPGGVGPAPSAVAAEAGGPDPAPTGAPRTRLKRKTTLTDRELEVEDAVRSAAAPAHMAWGGPGE